MPRPRNGKYITDIEVRLTPKQKLKLIQYTKAKGLSVSKFVRDFIERLPESESQISQKNEKPHLAA